MSCSLHAGFRLENHWPPKPRVVGSIPASRTSQIQFQTFPLPVAMMAELLRVISSFDVLSIPKPISRLQKISLEQSPSSL